MGNLTRATPAPPPRGGGGTRLVAEGYGRAPPIPGQRGEITGSTGTLWVHRPREEPQGHREPSVMSSLHGELSETRHQGIRRRSINARHTEGTEPRGVTAKLSVFLTLSCAIHEVYC